MSSEDKWSEFGAESEDNGGRGRGQPDPDSLPTLSKKEVEYDRDADGNLKPVSKAVKVDGEWRKVKLRPLLPTDAEDLSAQFEGRDEVDLEEILDLLDEFVVEPSGVDWHNSAKLSITMACVNALFEELADDAGDETMQEIEEELDKRQGDDGGN